MYDCCNCDEAILSSSDRYCRRCSHAECPACTHWGMSRWSMHSQHWQLISSLPSIDHTSYGAAMARMAAPQESAFHEDSESARSLHGEARETDEAVRGSRSLDTLLTQAHSTATERRRHTTPSSPLTRSAAVVAPETSTVSSSPSPLSTSSPPSPAVSVLEFTFDPSPPQQEDGEGKQWPDNFFERSSTEDDEYSYHLWNVLRPGKKTSNKKRSKPKPRPWVSSVPSLVRPLPVLVEGKEGESSKGNGSRVSLSGNDNDADDEADGKTGKRKKVRFASPVCKLIDKRP